MVAGSFASSFHGMPRSTHDLDVVVDPTRETLLSMLRLLLATEYDVSRDAALDALAARTQLNVIDYATGWKVDFILLKAREFSRVEFGRRSSVEISNVPLKAATAEDTILSKLEWAKIGGSERQIADAAGVVQMQGERLDLDYIERWVRTLGLEQPWSEAKARASQS